MSSSDRELNDLFAEIERRTKHNAIADEVCFPEQLAFVKDPAKRKAALCPRRSGKSMAIGILLLQEALSYPRRKSLYLGLTSDSAHNVIFQDIIERECNKRRIKFKYNNTTHEMTFTNGHKIKLAGMDSSPRDMNRLLGGHYHIVVIDECQSYTQDLKTIVEKRLDPAMRDYAFSGGNIVVLAGTPGEHRGEHYWWLTTKQTTTGLPDPDRTKGWSVHSWGVDKNPYMAKQYAAVCEEKLALYGPAYQEMPDFQSEWLGKWVIEPGSMVYKWNPEINTLKDEQVMRELLEGNPRWTYVIGLDLGWDDATAIVVTAWCPTDPNFYVVHTELVNHTAMSQIGGILAAYRNRFNAVRIVADAGGGASKLFAASLASDFSLPIVAADKHEKANKIGLMNGDFMSGKIKVIAASNKALIQEWEKLTIDRKAWDRGEWKESEKCANHGADSCLYAFRDSLHHHAVVPVPKKPEDTADRWIAERKRLRSPVAEFEEDWWDKADREDEIRSAVRKFRREV